MDRRYLASLMCGMCVAVFSARADAPEKDLALQLVRTMKVDEQAMMLIHQKADSLWRSGDLTEQQRDCVLKVNQADFTGWLVHIASRELSPAEMQAAIEYFQSGVGKKHIEVMRAEQGLTRASLFQEDPADQAKMLAFLETPAGYRLVTRGLLTTSMDASRFIDSKAGTSIWHCRS